MRKLLIVALSLLLLPSVLASPTMTCIDNNVLQVNTTTYVMLGNNLTQIDVSEEIFCPHGCENNACKYGAVLNSVTFPMFFIAFTFFLVLSKITGNEGRPNPFFGTVASVISLMIGVLLIGQGIALSDIVLSDIYVSGVGTIFLLTGVYVSLAVWIRQIPGGEA